MKKTIPCPECCGKGFISCYADNSMWATNCNNCNGTGSLEVTMNNFDRIKAMSVEEMAEFIANIQVNEIKNMSPLPAEFCTVENIAKHQKRWLESEVKEDV